MDEHSPTDAELVTCASSGDHEAFGQLYDRYARLVRAVVAGVSGDWSATEDLTQECFLRSYRKLASLRDPTRFGQWLVGIARQVGRERRRSRRRDRHKFGASVSSFESTPNESASFENREEIELVMRTLTDLPESERVAVHAYFLDQQSAQQAAKLLGVSRSGFYAMVQRGIARLAAQLKPNDAVERGFK